ncbi:hypothetical protein ACFOZ0_35000 [Streptomyces yaanensis]|uniref:Uncharacterized protein n=1 Tax=Streptomyces yaanensis TaxID=1142239 RepID=A0ABV7SN29_9ACTN|nr:hypothetical protein [Streptomyces sp. CGMCC 4.7035]WNB97329.1 hypothetical protein Q2K21_04165 [Streptomyces sp. CGMCC 4.7035]
MTILRGRVRALGGLVAALVGTVVTLTVAAVPARAVSKDIPDLALVVANSTVTLRSGDREFALLWQLLSPTEGGTERVPEAWEEGRYPRVRATVVWGLTGIGGWPYTRRAPGGDIAIERQDQVFVAPDGAVWVRSDPRPDVADDDIRWRRAPRGVFERLEKSGLFGRPAAAAEDGSSDSLRWGAAGLGAGLALGAGGTYAVRRAAARRDGLPPEPRHELIDL